MYPSAIQNGCYFRPTYQTSSAQIKMCLQLPQSSSIQKYSIFTIDIRGLYRLGEKTSPWRHFVEFELIWVPGCYPPIAVGGSLPPLDLAWQSAALGQNWNTPKIDRQVVCPSPNACETELVCTAGTSQAHFWRALRLVSQYLSALPAEAQEVLTTQPMRSHNEGPLPPL